MDIAKNPFSPGAGDPPPECSGRDEILEQGRVLLTRVKAGRSEKDLLLIGLRGVGKTVVLNKLETLANSLGYTSILIEAHEEKALSLSLIQPLRQFLYALDPAGNKLVRRGLAVLKSFITAVKIKYSDIELGLDIDPELGSADSGDIEFDLPNLLIAVGEAAKEKQMGLAILIDELQYFSKQELSALIMSIHKMHQKQLPVVLIGAGLPILPALVGESKSYSERLFQFPAVGPLGFDALEEALQAPLKPHGLSFSKEALEKMMELTQGYPYFIQEWGYQAWNGAEKSVIDLDLMNQIFPKVIQRLDQNFFRVRFDRLTPAEKNYLRAMAELGTSPYRSGDIAEILKMPLNSLGPVREKLIKKGMIYSPAHGVSAFTVPLFDEFMKRVMPKFEV